MDTTTAQAVDLYDEQVREARMMSPEEKLLAGEALFQSACAVTMAGIRCQHPEYTEEEILRELERRLKLAQLLETGHGD